MIQEEAVVSLVATLSPVKELTLNQRQRVALLMGVYSDEGHAIDVVRLLEPRGENSWKKVIDKINLLQQGDPRQQMYDDVLYDNFEVGETYSSDDIIRIVGVVRRDLMLPTYLSSLKKNCEGDFLRLFIVQSTELKENETDSVVSLKARNGYTPVYRLKPEE